MTMPNDHANQSFYIPEHALQKRANVLRVSIGRDTTGSGFGYCVFRASEEAQVIRLIEDVLATMKRAVRA